MYFAHNLCEKHYSICNRSRLVINHVKRDGLDGVEETFRQINSEIVTMSHKSQFPRRECESFIFAK